MGDEREILTWDLFGSASHGLAQLIADDGYEPEMILSIARGGLLVGGALGYALGVKNVYTMNVEYYTGVEERLEVPRILPPAPDFVDLDDARILIADDVADTGHTLQSVQAFCAGKVGEVRVAVLYEKPTSLVACDSCGDGPTAGSTSRGATSSPSPDGRGRRSTPDGAPPPHVASSRRSRAQG